MTSNRKDLEAIGFKHVGHWQLRADGPVYVLHRLRDAAPALYSFTIGEAVMYVGKTVRTLDQRLYGYKRGGATQRTNTRVRNEIRNALREGHLVDILGFHDPKPGRVGRFTLNLPAALEDDIINTLDPPWNGAKKSRSGALKEPILPRVDPRIPPKQETQATSKTPESVPTVGGTTDCAFNITVEPTYYRKGFFNVPIAHEHCFSADGEMIEIRLPGHDRPLEARVNRTANNNKTPRIVGGTGLRDWFQETTEVGGLIRVTVQDNSSIEMVPN